MKIHQIPMGTRFEYEGEEYVKTGPLFATGKGGQRLIPKYAVLRVLTDNETAGRKSQSRDGVLPAFEEFFKSCQGLVPAHKQPQLQAARERFLKTLSGQ